MNLNSRLRRLEQVIASNPTQPETMIQWLTRAMPSWQLCVLIHALQERLGDDGIRIGELFVFVRDQLEIQVRSGALPGDLAISEMLRAAAKGSSETTAAVEELGELLQRGEPDRPSRSADDPEDPFSSGRPALDHSGCG